MLKQLNNKRTFVKLYEDNVCIGDPSTHFVYDIDYQQHHNSRDSNACLSVRSFFRFRFRNWFTTTERLARFIKVQNTLQAKIVLSPKWKIIFSIIFLYCYRSFLSLMAIAISFPLFFAYALQKRKRAITIAIAIVARAKLKQRV